MASIQMPTALELEEAMEVTACSICCHDLSLHNKPFMLGCGHSFCLSCITRMSTCAICRRDRSSLFIEPRVNWQLQQALSAVRTLQAALTLTTDCAISGTSADPAITAVIRSSRSGSASTSSHRIPMLRHISTQWSPRTSPSPRHRLASLRAELSSPPRPLSSPRALLADLRVRTHADLFHDFSYSPVHSSARNSGSSTPEHHHQHLPLPPAFPPLSLPNNDMEDVDGQLSPLPFMTGPLRSSFDSSSTRTNRLYGIRIADMDLGPLTVPHPLHRYTRRGLEPDSPPLRSRGRQNIPPGRLVVDNLPAFPLGPDAYTDLQMPHDSEITEASGVGADSTAQERQNRGTRWTQRWRADGNEPYPNSTPALDTVSVGAGTDQMQVVSEHHASGGEFSDGVVVGDLEGNDVDDASSTLSEVEAEFETYMAVIEQREQQRAGVEVWPGIRQNPTVHISTSNANTANPTPVLRRLLAWPLEEEEAPAPTYYQSILRRQQQQHQQQRQQANPADEAFQQPPQLQHQQRLQQLHIRQQTQSQQLAAARSAAARSVADVNPASTLIARYEAAHTRPAPLPVSSAASTPRASTQYRYGYPSPAVPHSSPTATLRPLPAMSRLLSERHIPPVAPTRPRAAAAAGSSTSSISISASRVPAVGLARQSGLLLSFLHEDITGMELTFNARIGQHQRFNRCRNITLHVGRCTSFKISLTDCENVHIIATGCSKLQLANTRCKRLTLVLERNRELLLRCLSVSRLVIQGHSNSSVDVQDEGENGTFHRGNTLLLLENRL